jgi:hypothetical protein
MRRLRNTHRGASLVEVLVAMVVLLLGILGLVRVFPTGFTTILYGRNVSQATVLANRMLQNAEVHAANMPDVVESFDPNLKVANPALPVGNELLAYQPAANQAPDTRFSDLNQIRRVLGETTRIPAPVTNSPYLPNAAVSPYTLTFSPIYSVVPTPSGLGGIFVTAGNSLNRVIFSGPPTADQMAALDTASYGIDYGSAMLYFKPAPYARPFKLDYSFTAPQGATSYVTEQARPDTQIVVGANETAFDLKQAHPNQLPLPNGARLEPNQEQVYQSFVLLTPNQPFSNSNPYEFKVLNPVLGIIGFNPLGATMGAGGPNSSGLTARIDYDVDDWHIIQEQRVVPSASPYNVKLTLSLLSKIGDIDDYQEPYSALIKDYPNDRPSPTPNIDLIVMDEETGLIMDSRSLQDPLGSPTVQTTGANGIIDYREGAIAFNPLVQWTLPNGKLDAPSPIAGKRIRIYYRTQQNWGLQLTKAATTYYRQPTVTNLGYREYAVGSAGYLFFPVQDHDQSVLVDYTWVQNTSNGPVIRTETGEYHQILDPTLAASPQSQFGNLAQNPNWWIQVDGAARGDYVQNSVSITRVRGVSVRARVVWVEGSSKVVTNTGTEAPSVRWRKLDLESFVGRDRGT